MKKSSILIVAFFLLMLLISGCASAATPIPPTQTSVPPTLTPLPPTNTPEPTITYTPEPTAIPGIQVIPLSSLWDGIPWLPMDEDNRPMSVYYGFNTEKPPFDNVFVRQAFAAAIDREQPRLLNPLFFSGLGSCRRIQLF